MKLHIAPAKVEHKNSKLMQYSTFVASQWKHIETPHQGHPNMYTPVKNHNTQIYTTYWKVLRATPPHHKHLALNNLLTKPPDLSN